MKRRAQRPPGKEASDVARETCGRRRLPSALAPLPIALLLLLPSYAGLAYVVLPAAWSRYEKRQPSPPMRGTTCTAERIPGDPLNVTLVGTQEEVIAAMQAAGWSLADRITLRSGLRDAGSVLLDRPYASAPVSTHFLWNRPQDLAFEQTVGRSPRRRHHVRFWRAEAPDPDGRPRWIGAATYDRSLGLSRFTGEVMHHIDPNVDTEREKLLADLTGAGRVLRAERIERFRPSGRGVNGGGDGYDTDGRLAVLWIKPLPGRAGGSPGRNAGRLFD